MLNRILFFALASVTLIMVSVFAETANAQVVFGGRTYVQVPNHSFYFQNRARPSVGYYGGYSYSNYPYYTPYVQRPYYPPYGTHYNGYPSYYYAPAGVWHGNQWNYRRR